MKKIFCFAALWGFINHTFAQNVFPTAAGSNVGIGTSNPSNALHIERNNASGTELSGDIIQLRVQNISTGGYAGMAVNRASTARAAGTYYQTAGITDWFAGTAYNSGPANSSYSIGTGMAFSSAKLVLTTGGNIGIGVSTPDEKLVVNGSIKTILDPNPDFQSKNVVHIIPLGSSGITGAQNWAVRGVYQYGSGVGVNAVGGDLDIIKSWNGNTILGTKSDGTSLGNVGIGTQTPNTRLDVNGVISMNAFGYLSCLRVPVNSYTNLFLGGAIKDNADGTYMIYGDGGSNYFSAIKMDNGGDNGGAINFYNGAATGGTGYTISSANLSNYLQMRIAGGTVGIGTADTKGYKLAVNGSAIATSMTVKLNSAWPDYVFKKDYQLPSLVEVKNYIDRNQHLPDMPSEKEVAENGLNLGEMNKILTKKVEELTLYLIGLSTQLKEQQKEIQKLKNDQ